VDYATGDVLSASNMNDLSGTVNLLEGTLFAAGKNKIINGDFRVNQRNFSSGTGTEFIADRWVGAPSDGTVTSSLQTFTPGAAPVAGYEGSTYARMISTGQTLTSAFSVLRQNIEDVRTFAGQTVTLSFWAKAATGTPKLALELAQGFGSGGSAGVNTYIGQVTLSTSWARYTATVAVPSISGKTIGASSSIAVRIWSSAGTDFNSRTGSLGIQSGTFDFWGVQLEAGSTASAFQTATGTIQGELAACQRYYYRLTPGATFNVFGSGFSNSATAFLATVPMPVTMRVAPYALEQSGTASQYSVFQGSAGFTCSSVPTLYHGNQFQGVVSFGVASGLTTGQAGIARTDNNTTAYLGWTAEL
jgi:hypothetical protein